MKRSYILIVNVVFMFTLLAVLTSFNNNDGWQKITIQQFLSEYKDIAKATKLKDNYNIIIRYTAYDSAKSETPIDQSEGYIRKDGNRYHILQLGIHTYQNDKFKIMIDSSEKLFVLADPTASPESTFTPDDSSRIDMYAISIETFKNNTAIKYRVNFIDGYQYSSYEITLDPVTKLTKEIILNYRWQEMEGWGADAKMVSSKPKVKIEFTHYDFNYKMTSSETDESKWFVKTSDSKMTLQNAGGFQFSDLRLPASLRNK